MLNERMKIMNAQILLMICHIHRQQESTVITNHIGKTTDIWHYCC